MPGASDEAGGGDVAGGAAMVRRLVDAASSRRASMDAASASGPVQAAYCATLEEFDIVSCLVRTNNDARAPLLPPHAWAHVAQLSHALRACVLTLRPDANLLRLGGVEGIEERRIAPLNRYLTIRHVRLRVEGPPPSRPTDWLRGLRSLQLWDAWYGDGVARVGALAAHCPLVTALTIVDLHDRSVDVRHWQRLRSLDLLPRRGENEREFFGSTQSVHLPRSLRALSIRAEQRVADDDRTLAALRRLRCLHVRQLGYHFGSVGHPPLQPSWVAHCANLRCLYLRGPSTPELADWLSTAGCQLRTLRVHVPGVWLRLAAGARLFDRVRKLQIIWRGARRNQAPLWARRWEQVIGGLCNRAPTLRVLHLHAKPCAGGDGPSTTTFVAGSASLEVLRASGLRALQDLWALATCPALRVLHLRHAMALTDLAPLGECATLEELHLACGATCLAPLARCARLCALRLSGCQHLADLSPLRGCASLARLALRGCVALSDLGPLVGCARLASLHVLHCPLVRGPPLAAALRALQTAIRSVRILSGDHVVHHTKLIAHRGLPLVRFLAAPCHGLPFKATVAVSTDERALSTGPWRDSVLSPLAISHVQQTFDTVGCGPCRLVTRVPHAVGSSQMEHIFAFDEPAHAERAARMFARLRLPVEDSYATVRLTRGRWRRRRRLLRHEEAPAAICSDVTSSRAESNC